MSIPEVEAREIILAYNGSNNQILNWKYRFENIKNFKLSRSQAEYVIKFKDVVPKVAKKNIFVTTSFAEKISLEKGLVTPIKYIWCEKLLCDTDKAFHIWGRIRENEPLYAFWLPKTSIITPRKKFKGVVDYSKYSVRPPMEHQKPAIEDLLANDRFILADDMGLGKTTSAVIAALESGAKKILIVTTASLKINWKREIEIYTKRRTLVVEGNKWGSTFDFYIINYDILKNYHTTEKEYRDTSLILREKFDLAIIDEAHNISNTDAIRTKTLNDVLDAIPKVWLLTGTPITSRPMNFYNLLKIVNSPITLNWQGYVKRYCAGFQFKVNGRKIWKTNGAANLDELREVTKNLILRRLKTEVLDLPEKIISPLFLDLENPMYNQDFAELVKINKEERNADTLSVAFTLLMKMRQLIAIEKIPYTCELIDKFLEQDKKVIVFTNFTSTLNMLHEKYRKNSVILDGKMLPTKKQLSVDTFQNDPKIKIMIANLKAGGVGHNLTEAEGVIMNDLCFVPSDHAQGEDRANRIGQKNSVLVYYPVFENTIDIIIYNIVQRKKNIIDQVMGDGEFNESFIKELLDELPSQ